MVNLLTCGIFTSVCFSVDLTSRGQHVLQCEEADQALCPAVGEPLICCTEWENHVSAAVSNTPTPAFIAAVTGNGLSAIRKCLFLLLLLFLLTRNSRLCPCFYCTGNFSLLVPCLVCVRVGRLMHSMSREPKGTGNDSRDFQPR